MTEAVISVDTTDVRRQLKAADKDVNKVLKIGTRIAVDMVHTEQQAYPPERPNQEYVRTMALKESWGKKVLKRGRGYRGIVKSDPNKAPYNQRVQNLFLQADVHRGRWTNTVQGTARRMPRRINQIYVDLMRKEIG